MPSKKCLLNDIVLDARMIRHSGIGTYLQGLLGEYRDHSFFKEHSLGLALHPSLFSLENGGGRALAFRSPIYSIREQLEYPFRLRHCRLWHAPHYNIPLLKNKTLLVVTIHDLIHWVFRKEFYSSLKSVYTRILMERIVQCAERIITVSRQTRDDLIQYFKAPLERIRVIPEGVAPGFFQPPSFAERKGILEKYNLPERFFLYVGLIKPHKNVKRLLELFKHLRRDRKIESSLVLVGKKDGRYPAGFESLKDLNNEEGIHYLPYVTSRQELSALYASAQALIHPSLYEGFGLTCLEAMASGTPVIVSQVASLPEVVGEAGYYVDPYSDDSIRQAIVEIEENESLRKDLTARGRLRAQEFSWAKAASETIETYKEVLDSQRL